MFLALKNGLGRLAVFFRGLLDEYGGAAAAYSLRRLGSAYSGPLVRVRRDSDNAELDFTSTTSIEDWVNGKLETTLPADVATSSAAYSLRKVKAGYTGNAVRIRRSSDDVEVDVAFDTTGVVSASSGITNVTESPDQGDTTATTLGGFLEPHWENVGYGPFTTDENWENGFTASNSAGSVASLRIPQGSSGDSITISFNLTFNSGTPSPSFTLRNEAGGAIKSNTISKNTEGSHSVTLTATSSYQFISISEFDAPSVFSISNVVLNVVPVGEDAFVQTWYDQSGNNYHLTQDTAGNQPKIAEAGALLTLAGKPTIRPDGSDNFLINENAIWDTISNTNLSCMTVTEKTSLTNRILWGIGSSGGEDGDWLIGGSSVAGDVKFRGGRFVSDTASIGTSGAVLLTALDVAGGDGFVDGTSIGSLQSTSPNATADRLVLFTRRGTSSLGTCTDQDISEIIFYNSDQSSNRFKIESNINNHYQLAGYKVQYEYDLTTGNGGFEVTSGCTITTNETVGGRDECLKATSTAGSGFNLIKDGDYPSANGSYVIEGEVYLDPSNVSLKQLSFQLDSSSGRGWERVTISDTGWSTFRFSFDTTSVADDFQMVGRDASGNGNFARTAGDFFAIRNVKAKYADNGFVHTWYDQSGNGNDATQDTLEDEQPTIVNAGSLLADGIDFDGSDDELTATSFSASQPITSFSVFSQDSVGSSIYGSGGSHQLITSTSNKIALNAGTALISSASITLGETTLVSALADSTSSFVYIDGGNATTGDAGTTGITSPLRLGNIQGGRYMDGSLKEIIIYTSDQSSNRTGIESNIADEYGITLP